MIQFLNGYFRQCPRLNKKHPLASQAAAVVGIILTGVIHDVFEYQIGVEGECSMCRHQDRSYGPNLPVPCQPGRIHHRPGHLLHVQGQLTTASRRWDLHTSIWRWPAIMCCVAYMWWPTALLQNPSRK